MDYPIEEIIRDMNFSDYSYRTLSNGLMLTNWEISVLDKYRVPYQNCHNLKELLFEIEKTISNFDMCEDLNNVSISISERDYYENTSF